MSVEFDFSWLSPGRRDAPELEHTLAELCVRIDGQPVTRVFDKRARTERDHIVTSLYPVAEWIVANWWFLFDEPSNANRQLSDSMVKQRHSLRAAGDGFAFPDLEFWSDDRDVRLSWKGVEFDQESVGFRSTGESWIPRQLLSDDLTQLVSSVVERLQQERVSDTWLQRHWLSLQESLLDKDEREFCMAAAHLGLDPHTISDDAACLVESLFERIPANLTRDLLKSVSIDGLATAADWVQQGLAQPGSLTDTAGHWDLPVGSTCDESGAMQPETMPWRFGYALARHCARLYELNPDSPLPWNQLGKLPVDTVAIPPELAGIESLARIDENGSLSCLTGKHRIESQRFAFARSLYHRVVSPNPESRLVTSVRTWDQKASRAFAAEFLAPATAISSRIPARRELVPDDVVDLAGEFGVSEYVIRDQVRNQRLAALMDECA